jgi:integrase
VPLTNKKCENAKCPTGKVRKRFYDQGGLYLEVLPSKGRYWRWKYRYLGKEKRLALGVYPEVSLKDARKRTADARRALDEGRDPGAVKQEAKLAAKVALGTTFESIARTWWDQWKGARSARHADYVIRRLEFDVFPAIGRLPVAEVTAPKLLAMARKIESRGALDIAARCLQTSGQILRFAVAHGVLERNPASDVKPSDALRPRKKQNYARVDSKELPELLRKIEAYDGAARTRFAMKLMALTFVRTGELIGAKWPEFDLDEAEWRIPAERMKMGEPHIVPLSRQALEVMACLQSIRGRSEMVFPGDRDHDKSMSNNTILAALWRMGYKGRMTGHGFRGVASTVLHEMGFRHDVIELQLAHSERNQVSASYNWATYLPERRKMMQAWADVLDAARSTGKVIPIGKVARRAA